MCPTTKQMTFSVIHQDMQLSALASVLSDLDKFNEKPPLFESGVCENNTHPTLCVTTIPFPPISMLVSCCRDGGMETPKDECLFRRRLHSHRKHIASTLKSGARGYSHTPKIEMSVIFADTGKATHAALRRSSPRLAGPGQAGPGRAAGPARHELRCQ